MNKSFKLFLILLSAQNLLCQTSEEKLEQIRFRGGDREVVRVFAEEELETKVAAKVTKLNLTDRETSLHLSKYYSASPLLSQWEKELPALPLVEDLSNSFAEFENLEEVNIHNCPLFFLKSWNKSLESNAQFFFESLAQCKKLRTLNICACGVENSSENSIVEGLCALLENTNLESLEIDILKLFSINNYKKLIAAIKNSNLKNLNVHLAEDVLANIKNKPFFDFKSKLEREMLNINSEFIFSVTIMD
jgi:hypothetical protein